MSSLTRLAQLGAGMAMTVAAQAAVAAAVPPATNTIVAMELSAPFAARSAWRLTAIQGPPTDGAATASGDAEPGIVQVCLRRTASGPCDPQLQDTLRPASDDDDFSKPHYLAAARIVHGASGRPLLLVQTASMHSGDGDQLIVTQLLAYRRNADQFVRVYGHSTGRNNNQEARFIEAGPLKGDMISVEPTEKAPFGFWVSVNAPTKADAYKEVLHYRSATHYGDGNPLSVIDSEMPNIERRLGIWRPGLPLPLPAGHCPKPHLIGMELWCS